MLEVHRESGGFTPPAQLNVFDFLFNRGGMPARSCLAMAGGRSIFQWGSAILKEGIPQSSINSERGWSFFSFPTSWD